MKNISVLIVEDSKYWADLNVRQFKKSGYEVDFRIVANRLKMQAELSGKKWDLILADNSMPDFNAAQALEVRNEAVRRIPFIIVSEQITVNEIKTAFQNGCTAYIPKENLAELAFVINRLFLTDIQA